MLEFRAIHDLLYSRGEHVRRIIALLRAAALLRDGRSRKTCHQQGAYYLSSHLCPCLQCHCSGIPPAIQTRLSRNQNHLAGRLSSRQRAVCVRGAHEGKLRADLHLQSALRDPREELVRPLDQLLARRDIVVERWPSEKERSFAIEYLWVERRYRPTRLTKKRQHAAPAQRVQRPLERGATHRVVDNRDANVVRDTLDVGDKIA